MVRSLSSGQENVGRSKRPFLGQASRYVLMPRSSVLKVRELPSNRTPEAQAHQSHSPPQPEMTFWTTGKWLRVYICVYMCMCVSMLYTYIVTADVTLMQNLIIFPTHTYPASSHVILCSPVLCITVALNLSPTTLNVLFSQCKCLKNCQFRSFKPELKY